MYIDVCKYIFHFAYIASFWLHLYFEDLGRVSLGLGPGACRHARHAFAAGYPKGKSKFPKIGDPHIAPYIAL